MKRYTQKEFDCFPVDDYGRKQCPSGDYTLIENFPAYCSFGECCSFGVGCTFGECCFFGERCLFGERCFFGNCCLFGDGCSFGDSCSFGECCSFGEHCRIGKWCICEFGIFKAMYTVSGFGSVGRTTYFFHMVDGSIYVRCGCFAGTIDAWENRVKKTHGFNRYAQAYTMIGAAVRAMC